MNADFKIERLELVTPRLILREWRQSDLRDFFDYAKVDGVGQMAGWMPHADIGKSQEILNLFIREKKTFALYHKEDRKVIGSLGIEMYNEKKMPELDNMQGREIGFVLSKDYWGQGLMPEAVNTVVEYLFNRQFYDFLVCGHFLTNEQSRRVQEKCAFVPYCKMKYETRMGTIDDVEMTIRLNPKSKITQRFSIENRKLL